MSTPLPIGCCVRLEKPALQALIDRLKGWGYRVLGPTVSQAAVVYRDIGSLADLPLGSTDDQEAGHYRIKQTNSGNYFDYVVGPHSLKNYLFPPRTTVLETLNLKGDWQVRVPEPPKERLAFLGLRSCDLHALRIQDRVFLGDKFVDGDYQARRESLFVVAVNCARSAATCFCVAMDTGPAVRFGYDLVLTELPGHFVLQVGTEQGGQALADLPWRPCTTAEVAEAQQVPKLASQQQHRRLDPTTVHDLLLGNLEHERWDQVAQRCLSCANCTMVCPTCFCSSVQEVTDLTGDQARRERLWDSCFNDEYSYMNSGPIRKSTKARYRQWLTHKLATWIDQFGSSGCVGCGRCITWCPVGIDLTEEVAAIQGVPP
jgi:formate hydrogenlyase subunit 6/NADH:ubiquinone oxidoreductase subunit I